MIFFLSLISDNDGKNKFKIIYEKYNVLVYKICIKITKNAHSCEDAMQNTFINIAKHIDKIYDFDEHLQKIYITKTAKNCAISILRIDIGFLTDNIDDYELTGEPSIQEKYISHEEYISVIKLINKMGERYKDVLILYYINDLSVNEISDILNLSVHTVRSRLARGRRTIIEKFKELNIKWLQIKHQY